MITGLGKAGLKVLELVTGFIVLAIAAILSLQVVTRYLIQYPFAWPEEICGFLFVWLIFLGATLAHRSGSLIGMTVLRDKLPSEWATRVKLLMNLIVLACLLLLVVKSSQATYLSLAKKTTVLRFSWAYVYSAVPLGFFFLSLSYLKALAENVKTLMRERRNLLTPHIPDTLKHER
jgi:TRAP-type C4-dicarboxylate transport system permease small subunit